MNINNFLISLLLGFPIFFYQSVFDVRLIVLAVIVVCVIFLINGVHLVRRNHGLIYFIIVCYSFLVSMVGLNFDIFFSICVFGLFVYWPLFVGSRALKNISFLRCSRMLVNSGIVLSIGVICQAYFFLFYGVQFGFVQIFPERIAFAFTWTDYSFLSLFLVSLVPLVWFGSHVAFVKLVLSTLLISGSVLTSARTGMAALIISLLIIFIIRALSEVSRLKIRKRTLKISLAVAAFSLIFFYLATFFMQRSFSLDDSGRMDLNIAGLKFFVDNPIFGAFLNSSSESGSIDFHAHNIFIYFLSVGGFLFAILFIAWLFLFLTPMFRKLDRGLALSVLVSMIGFQFIPSFFSAYSFALVLSLCIVNYEQGKSQAVVSEH